MKRQVSPVMMLNVVGSLCVCWGLGSVCSGENGLCVSEGGGKGGSRKNSEEATAMVQAGDDGSLDQLQTEP